MKKTTNFIILLMVIVGGVFVTELVLLHVHFYAVDSGSMEPNIKTNSVIFVVKGRETSYLGPYLQPLYKPNEVITFKKGNEVITHRITGIRMNNKEIFYQTKGDANKGEDVELIGEGSIIGKAILSLPYIGKIVSFAKTQLGLILLVIIPSTIIVYEEIYKIKKEICLIFKKKVFYNESLSS